VNRANADSLSLERPVLLSALPPTRRQERLAFAIAALLFAALLAMLPVGDRPLPRQYAFITIVDTVLFLSDLITAALLYAQYAVVRSRGLLALAMGYLFTAIVIVPHLLTFPGVFTDGVPPGAGLQSTTWLYIFWHLGLPSAVIGYALLKGRRTGAVLRSSPAGAIVASLLATAAVASLFAGLATAGAHSLPVIMFDTTHATSTWNNRAAPFLIALSLTAIILLWRRRTSVLDLWLLVVLWAWMLETILLSTTDSRFSLAWYASRTFGLLSSGFVLLVLLSESTMLYARLALTVAAQDRERDGRKMTLELIVRSMVHELQQPLSAIALNADAAAIMAAQSPPALDELRASLLDISADGRRAGDMVASTRTMVTGVARHKAPFDFHMLVRETLELLELELRFHAIALRLHLAPHLPQLKGNRGQLQQVLMNLIANAIDSMAAMNGRPHHLTIRTAAQPPDSISIQVEDSGIGIDPEHATRIFDAFFTTKSNGSGLGLAICRSIIDAHGGDLGVYPGNPHGCTFHIVLPIAPPPRIPRAQL
jgi:signal transduction histidine kinase